ncbi:hypothetical protein P3X46_001666 [Hevea brasiliensis]|uniref:Tubby C-terminal domain-containing protein n=1 Tax=Hevea brasiliensis TaxID=3981 RepID=A0ABQ9NDQ0_HEVBR|nr:protein LURP-one-related 11-like [Hevea brasiliensis]KAJ9190466.1 hypothetical protein P3X46_001666 [Hevea brasiliensis]
MAKIHPREPLSSAPCYFTSKQETFTIWMKSLVLSGNGCTVFDSNGHVVYRVDNYNCKSGNQVHLMDSWGNVLFTIFRKKFKLLGCWEGYKTSGSGADDERKPGFQVRKSFRLLRGGSLCRALVGLDQNQPSQYKIQSWTRNSTCRIIDDSGGLIAEVKRKESKGGVVLGEDVLTMVVEPCMDHSLIMGLLVVYNLIKCKI